MNSNDGGNQGNNKYDFGFDDEDDNQNAQVNNNFYQEENGNISEEIQLNIN